jgi:hypothetical protein
MVIVYQVIAMMTTAEGLGGGWNRKSSDGDTILLATK